ncbi:MAG: hypothetical protein K2X53_06560 [Alphaproteobacteria bacterium]|nr:hypothetical protein [Alphaproteobacteria bacterium]
MKHYYFAWVEEYESFDSTRHNRMDADIFKILLHQEEGAFAEAHIQLKHPLDPEDVRVQTLTNKKAFLSMGVNGDVTLLFCGRLVPLPLKGHGLIQEFKLTSRPVDATSQLEWLHHRLKQDPMRFHPYFVSASEEDDVRSTLEGGTDLHYWCPRSHKLSLSNIFNGTTSVTLDRDCLADTLQCRFTHAPFSTVDVALKARWLQDHRGTLSITKALRQLGENGLLKTFTGGDLKRRWWRVGQKLHQANYWVEESALDEVSDYFPQALEANESYSSPITLSPHDPLNKHQGPTKVRLKRKCYKPKLVLGWKVRLVRDETLVFTLSQRLQSHTMPQNETRSLRFNLHALSRADSAHPWRPHHAYAAGDLINHAGNLLKCRYPHRSGAEFEDYHELFEITGPAPDIPFRRLSSFFTTQAGYSAFDHAINRAAAYLLASARALEISFKVPIDYAPLITCDSTICLEHAQLPRGRASGKVKQFRLVIDADASKTFIEIVLAVSVASPHARQIHPDKRANAYVFQNYFEEEAEDPYATNYRQTSFGLQHERFDDQKPTDFFGNNVEHDAAGLLRGLSLLNTACAQEAHIQAECYPKRHSLQSILKECRTTLTLHLNKLKSFTQNPHVITVAPLAPLSAPHQIDLTLE